MKFFLLLLLRIYQFTFSPRTGIFRFFYPFPSPCLFNPSCSEFAYQQIKKEGLKSLKVIFKRLIHCHPFHHYEQTFSSSSH